MPVLPVTLHDVSGKTLPAPILGLVDTAGPTEHSFRARPPGYSAFD